MNKFKKAIVTATAAATLATGVGVPTATAAPAPQPSVQAVHVAEPTIVDMLIRQGIDTFVNTAVTCDFLDEKFDKVPFDVSNKFVFEQAVGKFIETQTEAMGIDKFKGIDKNMWVRYATKQVVAKAEKCGNANNNLSSQMSSTLSSGGGIIGDIISFLFDKLLGGKKINIKALVK